MQVVSPLLATLLCALLATLSAAAERDALIALYEATEGNSWTTSTGWNTTASVCDWYGVSCTNGTLIELDLTRNALSGDVDGVDLSQLGDLQILRLRGNGLEGEVPVGFFALGAIRRIDLRDNQLTAFPTSTMNFSATIEEVSISGNSIQCPVPAYVTQQLSSKFVDWSATDCVALKTPTVERSVTPQREEPVANNAIVQAFLNNHSSGIAAMRFQARNNARTPTAIWQSSVTRILYDILARADMGIPEVSPSSANVTSSNDLFLLRNLTLSGDAWVGFIFTDNVTAVRRADLANRLFSQHPSVSTLLIRSTALFASVDQLDVVETPVPGPGVPQGDIDESNANTQIIVATVLFFVVVVAIGTFVCIRYKPFRRNTAVYRADGPPPPPGMVPPGGAPGGIPQQQVPGQTMGMAPPPGHTAVPMPGSAPPPGSAPGSTMPPSSAQQSAVPSGMATPLPPGSQTPTQQGPPVQHMPPPMMVPPGPPPGQR